MIADPITDRPDAADLVEVVPGPITRVTVGAGVRRNALTVAGWDLLEESFRRIALDPEVRVVHVRGRDGMFCSGSDITEWQGAGRELVEESFARMEAAFQAVEECPVPVVAEVHGVAAGAGCQLAFACDLRFMETSARMGMPIARLGILASPAFAERLSSLVGPAITRRLLYTGDLLGAAEALAHGGADACLPATELAEATEAVLTRIAAQPPSAVRSAKQAVDAALTPARTATRPSGGPTVSAREFAQAVDGFLTR